MPVNWTEVNDRRISEITQEIFLYCSKNKSSMTPRAFDLARLYFLRLLDNIADRDSYSVPVINTIRNSISSQNNCVAECTMKQAKCLAISVVTKGISDDLQLYPISAEKKISIAKLRGQKECSIPIDEMTVKDIFFVTATLAEEKIISKSTMRAVFDWFKGIGLDPIEARVYSCLFMKQAPISIRSLPQQNVLGTEYRRAAKLLVEKGFISEFPDDMFCVTETTIV